jgi:DNA repair exonuclease SbcCD ATPase subunit
MKGDKFSFQVQFWAIIGPFISLLTLFVFLVKGSVTPGYLPLLLLIGVPLAWMWKLKGFTVSVVVLSIVLIFHYGEIPLEERFWHLGMGISIAMCLLITALSFEEVGALIEGLKVESRSRLENLWKVDERLQFAEGELKKKKERIKELNIKVRSYQKLLDSSTEELVDLRTSQDNLKEELTRITKEKEEIEEEVQKWKEMASVGTLSQNEETEQVLDQIRKELLIANERVCTLEREKDEMKMTELSDVEHLLEKQLRQMEQERAEKEVEHEREIETLQNMLSGFLKKQK